MKAMIGYCGLDCAQCDAYLATIHDDQALREKTAKAIRPPSFQNTSTARGAVWTGSKRCTANTSARFASVRGNAARRPAGTARTWSNARWSGRFLHRIPTPGTICGDNLGGRELPA